MWRKLTRPGSVQGCHEKNYGNAILHPNAPPASQPPACKGLPTSELKKIAGEILTGSTASATPSASLPPPLPTDREVRCDHAAAKLARLRPASRADLHKVDDQLTVIVINAPSAESRALTILHDAANYIEHRLPAELTKYRADARRIKKECKGA